jgi:hypothetical protein
LVEEDARAGRAPASGGAKLWQQRAEIDEAESFARQVRVGAEVGREIRFEMARVEV